MMDWADDLINQLFQNEYHVPSDDEYHISVKIAVPILVIAIIIGFVGAFYH